MNTQTHLLVAAAAGVALAAPGAPRAGTVWALLAGALLPDASLFVMWGGAKLAGVPEATIWTELYHSDRWQGIAAITNSAPLFALVLAAGVWLARTRAPAVGAALVAFAIGALLHVATDLPLHHDDGHPHFWPFSAWIFASPVSYWDPAHHGRLWSAFETALGIALAIWLWRAAAGVRTGARRLARTGLALAAAAYAAAAAYWTMAFG